MNLPLRFSLYHIPFYFFKVTGLGNIFLVLFGARLLISPNSPSWDPNVEPCQAQMALMPLVVDAESYLNEKNAQRATFVKLL